jgi:hypothetical protein
MDAILKDETQPGGQGHSPDSRKAKCMKREPIRQFWIGAASAFDLFPRVSSETRQLLRRTDLEAIASDWQAVSSDLRKAFEAFKSKNGTTPDKK